MEAGAWQKSAFVAGAALLTVACFGVRKIVVFDFGWLRLVTAQMHLMAPFLQVTAAVIVPPLVDLVQSAVLVGASEVPGGAPPAGVGLAPLLPPTLLQRQQQETSETASEIPSAITSDGDSI